MTEKPRPNWQRFKLEFARWVERPTALSAEAAATRIRARLRPASRLPALWRWAAAPLFALAVVAWLRPGRTPVSVEPLPVSASSARTLDDNVVLWWVDAETPVYFVLSPPLKRVGAEP